MSRSHTSLWERANDGLMGFRASVGMPRQLHWDHNAHYHDYLLRQLPPRGRFRDLLNPGGVLAILGLYHPVTASDYALNASATIANPIVGAWQAVTGRRLPPPLGMPVRDPETTLAEINAAAERLLPGSVVRRHLFYRYSLIWRGPER